jgi:sulfite exporter TauE/SafE
MNPDSCCPRCHQPQSTSLFSWIIPLVLAFIIAIIFSRFESTFSLLNLNPHSFLPSFFLFGIFASLSSCAAVTSGLLLSSSNPPLFLLGRIISFALFGFIFGFIGQLFQLSPSSTAILHHLVPIFLFLVGLEILGVFHFPSFLSRHALQSKTPFVVGALTFFLPCAFTLTVQGLALSSGNPFNSSLILTTFALGTILPLLLFLSLTNRFRSHPRLSLYFSRLFGFLLLVFALYELFSQIKPYFSPQASLPPIIDGQQTIRLSVSAFNFSPNNFTLRAHVPTRLEITDGGFSGCTSTLISPLFPQPVRLNRFTTTTVNLPSSTPGTYPLSCSMGMVTGQIKIIN